MDAKPLIPAAECLRMSTDEQPTSLAVQKKTIRAYALAHGFKIIKTYTDPAKSGVSIKQRTGLRGLLADVAAGAPFKAILVHDVSRWGRFQDTDESAYYEFLCKSAGVPVHYCAEPFSNDGTAPSSVMKALKRTMAAEFSRELSAKVVAAQRHIASGGYRVGAVAGYGLRRMLLSPRGRPIRLLKLHERKPERAEHVILVPGPAREVDSIRKIFKWCQTWSPARIADELNRSGLRFTGGKKWTEATIYRILTNEKYIGVHVWGKTSQHFKNYINRPQKEWIRQADAFTPLVSRISFEKARKAMSKRKTWPRKPDEYLLKKMRRVLEIEGRLTERLLSKHHVHPFQLTRRLGSIGRAYQLVGYLPPDRIFKFLSARMKMKQLRLGVFADLTKLFPSLRIVQLAGQEQREVVELDAYSHVAVHVCLPRKPTASGEVRWMLSRQQKERGLPCLICIPDKNLTRIKSFHLVPAFDSIISKKKTIWESHPWLKAGTQLKSLSEFYEVAKNLLANPPKDTTVVGDVVFTSRTSTVTIGKQDFFLPSISASLFKLLVRKAGTVVSRKELAEAGLSALGPGSGGRPYDPTGQFLGSHICTLRRKLGPYGHRIVSLPHLGYIYVADPFGPDENQQQRHTPSGNRHALQKDTSTISIQRMCAKTELKKFATLAQSQTRGASLRGRSQWLRQSWRSVRGWAHR